MKFTLKDADYASANSLRRIMMSEIPTMAVDEIDFYENTSSMFDEYIAQRIGLIPLTTDLKTYTEKDSAIFTLDAQGPKTVYSGELKGKDPKVTPAIEDIPIMKLAENQSLRLEAKAVLGTGKQHAKYQPCLCSYNSQKTDETKFDFEVESFGNFKPEELLKTAQKILLEKIEELEKQVK